MDEQKTPWDERLKLPWRQKLLPGANRTIIVDSTDTPVGNEEQKSYAITAVNKYEQTAQNLLTVEGAYIRLVHENQRKAGEPLHTPVCIMEELYGRKGWVPDSVRKTIQRHQAESDSWRQPQPLPEFSAGGGPAVPLGIPAQMQPVSGPGAPDPSGNTPTPPETPPTTQNGGNRPHSEPGWYEQLMECLRVWETAFPAAPLGTYDPARCFKIIREILEKNIGPVPPPVDAEPVKRIIDLGYNALGTKKPAVGAEQLDLVDAAGELPLDANLHELAGKEGQP